MKVKVRMLGNKMDGSLMLMNNSNLQLGTAVYVDKFPAVKDIGILTILENFNKEKNIFQVTVKNSIGKVLGKTNKFRSKIISKETGEAALIYNINQVEFNDKMDFYTIELWNEEVMVDSFNMGVKNNIYDIYDNMDEKGMISLL